MPRHSDSTAKASSSDPFQKAKEKALEMFFKLSTKAYRNIDKALDATLPCSYCGSKGQAAKYDEAGKCLKCHGTNVVEDFEKRKWATDQVHARIAPESKPIEMKIEEKRDIEGLKEQIQKAPKEAVDQAAESILKLYERNDPQQS